MLLLRRCCHLLTIACTQPHHIADINYVTNKSCTNYTQTHGYKQTPPVKPYHSSSPYHEFARKYTASQENHMESRYCQK